MAEPFHLSASKLRRSYRIGRRSVEVLRDINLDIMRGETVFLVGASGAGKTTLLYTLAGLEKPEAGTVTFEGEVLYSKGDKAECRRRNKRIGFVFQGYFLLPELTAFENVLLPSHIGELPDAAARARAAMPPSRGAGATAKSGSSAPDRSKGSDKQEGSRREQNKNLLRRCAPADHPHGRLKAPD